MFNVSCGLEMAPTGGLSFGASHVCSALLARRKRFAWTKPIGGIESAWLRDGQVMSVRLSGLARKHCGG